MLINDNEVPLAEVVEDLLGLCDHGKPQDSCERCWCEYGGRRHRKDRSNTDPRCPEGPCLKCQERFAVRGEYV